uniref:Uncharacterized protein n=1 Tax=Rhizophora mucronata TaxID=61149 RepID=A0A2P2Q3E1_RHIMU
MQLCFPISPSLVHQLIDQQLGH